jgi:hypothetical protein
MRLVPATKRETMMMRKPMMTNVTLKQALPVAHLVADADAGDGAAACILGDMYREGLGGLRYSPKEAFRWYAISALTNDADGQNNLGACYEHGLGCKQSYTQAVKWYRVSASQQMGTASMNLGCCYASGHGVPVDREKAIELFRIAVAQGEDKGREELERLGVPVSPEEPEVPPRRCVELVDVTEQCAGQVFGFTGVGPGEHGGAGAKGEALRDEAAAEDEPIRREPVAMRKDSEPSEG